MGTCNLKLYKLTKLVPSRNMKVDDIQDYLDREGTPYISDKFQYQRIELNMVIKVNLDQDEAANSSYNYCSIYQDNQYYYFFIMKGEQVSRKCVRFTLSMDTINTFWDILDWNPQTLIQREHVDRYYPHVDPLSTSKVYQRYIDKYQEGLNPVKDRYSQTKMQYTGYSDYDRYNGYLVWLSNSEITPDHQAANPLIPCFCSDTEITVKSEKKYDTDVVYLDKITTNQKQYLYLTTSNSYGVNLFDNDEILAQQLYTQSDNNSVCRMVRLENNADGSYYLTFYYYTGDVYPYVFHKKIAVANKYSKAAGSLKGNLDFLTYSDVTDYYSNLTDLGVIDMLPQKEIHIGTIPEQTSVAFKDLDRSSTRIAKIVKLPCIPADPGIGGISLIPGYHLIRLPRLDAQIDASHVAINTMVDANCKVALNPKPTDTWDVGKESKLYSSEFYDAKLQFLDSSYPFKLENVRRDYPGTNIFMHYYVSNSLSTDLSIKLNNFNSIFQQEYKNQEYWFFNGMEVPQYNSSWINYLRNGYNYDEYTRKMNNRNAIISGVISVVGTAASLGSQVLGGYKKAAEAGLQTAKDITQAYNEGANDPYFKYFTVPDGDSYAGIPIGKRIFYPTAEEREDQQAYLNSALKFFQTKANPAAERSSSFALKQTFSGIGSLVLQQGVQSINSAISSFQSIEASKTSYQYNLARMQSGSPSVISSTAVDLQPDYDIWLVQQYPRDDIRKQIAKTFHYLGYSHPLQEIPNFTSRYWFNYVQCDPVFNTNINNLHPEYEDDIKKRFNAGVTVFHVHDNKYDWNQQYENWETSILK